MKVDGPPAWQGRMSFQLEGSAAYNLAADQDIDAVRACPERARIQIVMILAALDSEV